MYNEFLEKTEHVDYDDPAVKSLTERLRAESPDESSLIRNQLIRIIAYPFLSMASAGIFMLFR